MIRLIRFTLYLFYKYYEPSEGKKGIAYESAIMAFVFVAFLNLLAILRLLNIDYLPWESSDPHWLKIMKLSAMSLLPGYIILSLLFRKKEIANLNYSEETLSRGNALLLTYIILSLIALVVVAYTR